MKFCGFELELTIDAVLQRLGDHPAVSSATDLGGDHWLIVEGAADRHQITWICAPASGLAVELIASGRATPLDAVRHSRTGWVEIVRVVDGHAVPDQRVPCAVLQSIDVTPGLVPA